MIYLHTAYVKAAKDKINTTHVRDTSFSDLSKNNIIVRVIFSSQTFTKYDIFNSIIEEKHPLGIAVIYLTTFD